MHRMKKSSRSKVLTKQGDLLSLTKFYRDKTFEKFRKKQSKYAEDIFLTFYVD